ncbi:hypothetical protein TRVL_08706 [Trypanosoma vivax]|nr:hypothetical protein TRVL_08706 [Trypanosoma vivax]
MCVAGGVWDREPHCIAQGEARAVSLALSSFAEATPRNLHICINNTTVMNIMKEGNTRSDALVRERLCINKALQEQCVQPCCDRIASAENIDDGISRGKRLRNVGVAKGGTCEREHGRRGDKSFHASPFRYS